MVLVDSHAHLDSPKYDADRDAVLEQAWQQGVRSILSIGIGEGPETMEQASALVKKYAGLPGIPRLFASAGIHPHEADRADHAALDKLDRLLGEEEVIAAGEIGLDYFYDHSPRERQQQALLEQLEIAKARKRPVVIHCRASEGSTDAWDDMLEILESKWTSTGLGGILHCFTGKWEHARRAIECGFLISFAGNLTFPKAEAIRSSASKIPLDRVLIETDAPFLAPLPYRGKRNEPAWVGQVAAKLAELHSLEAEEVALFTTNNFFRFFSIASEGTI